MHGRPSVGSVAPGQGLGPEQREDRRLPEVPCRRHDPVCHDPVRACSPALLHACPASRSWIKRFRARAWVPRGRPPFSCGGRRWQRGADRCHTPCSETVLEGRAGLCGVRYLVVVVAVGVVVAVVGVVVFAASCHPRCGLHRCRHRPCRCLGCRCRCLCCHRSACRAGRRPRGAVLILVVVVVIDLVAVIVADGFVVASSPSEG